MAVTKHISKSCCGSQTYILETSKPIRKSHMHFFCDAGYVAPENFLQAGVFYVQKGSMIATTAFGTTRINIRCNGSSCVQLIAEFEQLLDKAVNS